MKKFFVYIMTGFVLLAFSPAQLEASASMVLPPSDSTAAAQAQTLTLRLEEIKAVDKSDMRSSEKRKLRKEVRSIKQELKELSGGVYISVGALLVILVLLILLV